MINENVERQCLKLGAGDDKENIFHIAYGIDKKFILPAGVSIVSVLENNKKENFIFHILIDEISENDVNKFVQITKQYPRVSIYIHVIDIGGVKDLPTSKRYSCAVYYRLYLSQVIPRNIKKILYIDADVICLSNLQELFNINTGNNIIAAACERIVTENERRFNSGVLYMNLTYWRNCNIPEKLDEFFHQSGEFFYDQDALNNVLEKTVYFLDRKYNFMLDATEKDIPVDVVLLHYCDEKPWRAWYDNKDKEYFNYYKALSPWCDAPAELPSDYQQWKYMGHHWLRKHKYLQALKCYWQYSIDKLKEKR